MFIVAVSSKNDPDETSHLIILSVPAEFTTMAGRRLRKAVHSIFTSRFQLFDAEKTHVVIAGLSNSYSGYVTTFEEYQHQRYEAASTIYGPNTLSAYIQEFERLSVRVIKKYSRDYDNVFDVFPESNHDSKIPPVDFSKHLFTLLPPVIFDAVPPGKSFGHVMKDISLVSSKRQNSNSFNSFVNENNIEKRFFLNPFVEIHPSRNSFISQNIDRVFQIGDTVSASFYAGHPRNWNESQLEKMSFMNVQKYIGPSPSLLRQLLVDYAPQLRGANGVKVTVSVESTFLKLSVENFNRGIVFQSANEPKNEMKETYYYYKNSLKDFLSTDRITSDIEFWVDIRDDSDWYFIFFLVAYSLLGTLNSGGRNIQCYLRFHMHIALGLFNHLRFQTTKS